MKVSLFTSHAGSVHMPFWRCVFVHYKTGHHATKVSEEVNRKSPAGNTLVQLFTVLDDSERHNAHSITERRTDGRTDRRHYDANSRSYCVAVRSDKKLKIMISKQSWLKVM